MKYKGIELVGICEDMRSDLLLEILEDISNYKEIENEVSLRAKYEGMRIIGMLNEC